MAVPWVGSDLVGQKRMQAELSKKEVMLKYISEAEADVLLRTVIETWDFENSTEESVKALIEQMEKEGIENFVLKPNGEGGSNNFFGAEAYEKFKTLNAKERKNFILTRRIIPKKLMSHLMIANENGVVTNICEC